MAYFGEGNGTILLSRVACKSNETTLLDCRHNEEPNIDKCEHRNDTGVGCNDSERLKPNITATVNYTPDPGTDVTISWELQNATLDEPSVFEVYCMNENHRVTPPNFVNNKTYSVEIVGVLPSTNYNCCVSAVYGPFATRQSCALIGTYVSIRI